MTSPGGGGGNNVNLAALWVPVMPETSKMAPAMRQAGEQAKKEFAQGFTGGNGGGMSPEQLGKQWGEQFSKSFNSVFAGLPIPQGVRDFMGSLSTETKVSDEALSKLHLNATRTYQDFAAAQQKVANLQRELTTHTTNFNTAVSKGQDFVASAGMARAAHAQLQPAIADSTVKQRAFENASLKLNDAMGGTVKGSNLAAGAIGGLAGAAGTLAVMGVEKLITSMVNLYVNIFKYTIEGAKNVAVELLRIGETYGKLEKDVELYTTASGAHLEELQRSASKVYGELDVETKTVGQTMAIFAQRLGMSGEPLEELTQHVEELKARFGSLDTRALATAFDAFGIGADKADDSLALVTQQAREAAVPLDDIVRTLGQSGSILIEAGMSFEQATAFIAELSKEGMTASTAINGMQTAQKEFNERGMSFSEGMELAGRRINEFVEAGDNASAAQLSQDLFGTRKWVDAIDMAKQFSRIMAMTPEQIRSGVQPLDEVINNTQSLSEKWTEVKRKVEEAARPFADAGIGAMSTGIEKVKNYIDQNYPQITKRVRDFGNSFIESLPAIKNFAADAIRITGHMVDGLKIQFGATALMVSGFVSLFADAMDVLPDWVERMIPGYSEMRQSLSDAAQSGTDFAMSIGKIDVSDQTDKLADWIDQMNIDVPGLKDNWNDLVDDLNSSKMPTYGPVVGPVQPGWGAPGTPGAPALPGAPGVQPGGATVPSSGQIKAPGSLPIPAADMPRGVIAPEDLSGLLGGSESTQTFNAESWRPTVRSVIAQMAPAYGIKNRQAWEDALVKQIETESKGDPNSVNPNDSNGRGGTQRVAGLLNFLDTTYAGANVSGRPYMDPVGQIAAAIELVMRHGLDADGGPRVIGEGHGFYSEGGTVHPGGPKGTDTVPIWATPGEEIIPVEQANKYRNLLKAMTAGYFEGGGTVSGIGQGNTTPGIDQLAALMQQMFPGVNLGGWRPSDGPNTPTGHQRGVALDIGIGEVTPENQARGDLINQYLRANAEALGVKSTIWRDKWADFAGNSSTVGGHQNHVHVEVTGQPLSGVPGDPYGSGALSPNGYPGMPGQYGGYGAYGQQDWESAERNRQAIKNAQDRADDMDYEIGQTRKRIDDINAQIAAKQNEKDLLTGQIKDAEGIKALQDQLEDANHDLSVKIRERGDQDSEIAQATRKAQEDALKPPKDKPNIKEYQYPGMSALNQFGSSFLGGVGESLGFGEVFGKAPWEWGITKLLGGFANWGLGTANAWADEIGAGHTGMTGFQELPGFSQMTGTNALMGMLGGMFPGFKDMMPEAQMVDNLGRPIPSNVTASPNVSVNPSSGMPNPYGAHGPAPGPVAVDQSIHVENHGPKQSDYDTWKSAQNTRTHGAMAGLPPGPAG